MRRFNEAIVSYGIYLPFLRQTLNSELNYVSGPGGKMRLGPLNNKVGLEVLKFPKTNFLELVTMLMYKDSPYVMNTPWLDALQQL